MELRRTGTPARRELTDGQECPSYITYENLWPGAYLRMVHRTLANRLWPNAGGRLECGDGAKIDVVVVAEVAAAEIGAVVVGKRHLDVC